MYIDQHNFYGMNFNYPCVYLIDFINGVFFVNLSFSLRFKLKSVNLEGSIHVKRKGSGRGFFFRSSHPIS